MLWEYLGLVRFFLIIFYGKSVSLRASLITLFASRFGDVCLFILFGLVARYAVGRIGLMLMGVVLLLIVLTKSACFPFISWLLEAMRAPTPVSSLVHSSTLVAAGVWFFFRYRELFYLELYGVLFLFCVISIFISGIRAFLFRDLKKVVALSTCNNVSWCIIYFICGDLWLALVQLFTHGVCKCYLFMVVGDLMGVSLGAQRSHGVYKRGYLGLWAPFTLVLLVFSLCGLPFMGIFFRKHGLFGLFLFRCGSVGLGCLLLGFLVSYVYSIRFVLLLMGVSGGNSYGYGRLFIPRGVVCVIGSMFNGLAIGCTGERVFVRSFWAMVFFLVQVLGVFLGVYFYVTFYRRIGR